MKFSIIIVTYNQDFNRIKNTLKSVLCQKFTDYEIIVSDDGSDCNHFEDIKRYLDDNHVTAYKLISNKENQGTVRNILTALDASEGEYIKDFGAGDMFYDADSLGKLNDYFCKTNCDVCMGLFRAYYYDSSGNIQYKRYNYPMDIDAYRKEDEGRILKNLIIYGDRVPGAYVAYKREFYAYYLNKIKDCVIYLEDIYEVLAALDGKYIKLIDDYLYLYEINVGISNSNNKAFEELLWKDVDNFYKMLDRSSYDNKLLKKRKRLKFLYNISSLYTRTIVRLFVNPGSIQHIFWYIIHVCQKEKDYGNSFLDN